MDSTKETPSTNKRKEFPTLKPMSESSAIELCCGSASWSAALRKHSINAIGVDYSRNPQSPKAPIIQANLATAEGQAIINKLENDLKPDIVHAAPPCGTASKARERPLPAKLRLAGAPCPRPLRSSDFPRGLPTGLTENEQLRVDTANNVYDYVLAKCIHRHRHQLFFSLENPSTSYFWQLPESIALMQMEGVIVVDFQQCMHGGQRPVWRRWVCNMPSMKTLQEFGICPGESSTHKHIPFGVHNSGKGWTFDTASEATYPPLLCKRVAQHCYDSLLTVGFAPTSECLTSGSPNEPEVKRKYNRATLGRFVRGNKLPQLIPEFHSRIIREVPHSCVEGQTIEIDSTYCKVLGFKGATSGAPSDTSKKFAEVGIFRTPAQFIEEAKTIRHPVDMPSFLPEGLLENVFWLLTTPKEQIAKTRLQKISQLRLWATELAPQNDIMLASLPPEQRRVLRGKHLALLDKVLKTIGYPDEKLVEHIMEGTVLYGDVRTSGVFPRRYKPCSLDIDDLLQASETTRQNLISNVRSSGDKEIDNTVWEDTMIECQNGWLSDELTEKQLIEELGPSFLVARRFGIRQSEKIRSIDDYSEPLTNKTISSYEKIDLLGTDELFVLLKTLITAIGDQGNVSIELSSGKFLKGALPQGVSPSQARTWLGKTFDLKSAYRQIGTSRTAKNSKVSVIAVFNPLTNKPSFFQQYATPFGSISSVYLFNRCARGLWAIGLWLGLAWVNYFDDFPMIEPSSTTVTADLTVRAMFTILGWSIALEPKKNKQFADKFQCLGIIAVLDSLKDGKAVFENKKERIHDICLMLDSIVTENRCSAAIAAEVRGKAQFAAAQIAGRVACGSLHAIAMHQYNTKSGQLLRETAIEIIRLKNILTESPPRSLQFKGELRPIVVFTDGACEGTDRLEVTIGSVILDTASGKAQMWGGDVPESLVSFWRKDGQSQVIGQAEILPTLLTRLSNIETFRHRRVIYFIDNDSARQALIKGWSPSPASRPMIRMMVEAELAGQTWSWYSRVPTKSNPGDDPSRRVFISGPDNAWAVIIEMPSIPVFLCQTSLL